MLHHTMWGETLFLPIVFFSVFAFSDKQCFCKLAGNIDECACTVDSVDDYNSKIILPKLRHVLERDFFRYYMVNMLKTCPFWTEEGHCTLGKECGIRPCDEEVPLAFRSSRSINRLSTECHDNSFDPLDSSVSSAAEEAFRKWSEYDDSEDKYCDVDDEHSPEMHYVDLLKNPERYTGYKGASAAKVWQSIYQENCFKPDPKFDKNFLLNPKITGTNLDGLCLEKRVFYRIISGFHTSITVQVCANHFQEIPGPAFGAPQGTWARNTEMFRWRFSDETTNGEGPQRLKNLYFVYLLELRAILKAAPYFYQELFYTGNVQEDEHTRNAVADLIDAIDRFPSHFDESQMFQGARAMELKEEFRQHFLNISRIMDCVACDKCRLWGKLNVHGLGSALKILFSDISGNPSAEPLTPKRFQLTRNEVVALFNSLGRFASSIEEVGEFRKLLHGL